jgi:MFS family permease
MDKTAFSILRNRDYRLWFIGQAAFLLGSKAQGMAVTWLAYSLSDSVSVLGLVAALTMLPHLLFGPLGGWLADRFDERRLVMATQGLFALLAFAMAGMQAAGRLSLDWLMPFALLIGLVSGLDSGPRPALVQRIVAKRALMPKAVALNALVFHVSRFAGPAVAGGVLAAAGAATCFLFNGLASLPLLLVLARIRPCGEQRGQHAPGLLGGLTYAAGHGETRLLLSAMLCVGLLASPYIQMLPWFAKEVFAGDSIHYGLLFAASGLGSLLASFFIALRQPAADLTRSALRSFGLAAVLVAAFAEVRFFWAAAGLLAMAGFFFTHGAVSLNTRIQLTVPLEVRGRVLALVSMAALGTMPLGSLLIAAAAERIGTQTAVAAGAVISALSAYLLHRQYLAETRPQLNQPA